MDCLIGSFSGILQNLLVIVFWMSASSWFLLLLHRRYAANESVREGESSCSQGATDQEYTNTVRHQLTHYLVSSICLMSDYNFVWSRK